LGAQPNDLMMAFFSGTLQAREANLTNLFMAGSRYDEPMPCNAVISLQFLKWDILEEKFNYDLQRHAFFHLCLCGILGAYTHVEAHYQTYGCLFDFNSRLIDFNRKLQRGYYLCSPSESNCHQRVQNERFGNSIIQLCSVFKYGLDRHALQIAIGEIVMGDKFENLTNVGNIVSRSSVINAFNTTKDQLDEETANALVLVAKAVEESGNPAAGVLLNHFNEELSKSNRDNGKLRDLWNGIVSVTPQVAKLTDVASKIKDLFV
jgi:hypothetical protein